jgi:hypothetical protein
MKECVAHAGTKNGFNMYEFDYKDEFKPMWGYGRYKGVMADEVEAILPSAVITDSYGYKRVDYSQLGFDMAEV